MRDDPTRFAEGHIVARAAEAIDFAKVKPDADGVRRVRASVFFTSFVRSSSARDLQATVAGQQRMLEELAAEMRALRGGEVKE